MSELFGYIEGGISSTEVLLDKLVEFCVATGNWSTAAPGTPVTSLGQYGSNPNRTSSIATIQHTSGICVNFCAGVNNCPPVRNSAFRYNPKYNPITTATDPCLLDYQRWYSTIDVWSDGSRYWQQAGLTGSEVEWIFRTGSSPDFNYKYTDYLAVNVSTGADYVNGREWHHQPGHPNLHGDDTDNSTYYGNRGYAEALHCNLGSSATAPNVVGGNAGIHAIDRAWFFAHENPDTVYLIIQFNGNRYSFIAFGAEIDKDYSFGGGEFFFGQYPMHFCHIGDAGNGLHAHNPLTRCHVRLDSDGPGDVAGNKYQALFPPGNGANQDFRNGWGNTFAGGVNRTSGSASNYDEPNMESYYGVPSYWAELNDNDQACIVQGGYSDSDGDSVIYSVPVYVNRGKLSAHGGKSKIGSIPHCGLVSMENYLGGENISVGSDTYIPFPFYTRTTTGDWFERGVGLSITRWDLADHNSNTSGIGWAIRKPATTYSF